MRFTIGRLVPRLFLAVTTLLSLSAISARGQEASGKFTLAKEVRWGGAVLPAGDYTYLLEHPTGQVLFVHNTNGQTSAIVLVKSASLVNSGARDRIVLQRSGDDWFVRSMIITSLGQELSFGAPSTRTETAKNKSGAAKVAALSTP
jgi:hypothetical protein